jgi:Zn-dependent protease with chaperone function
VRRFVEPVAAPRALVFIYLGSLVATGLAVLGLLAVLALILSPHRLMGGLGVACVDGAACSHLLPLWAQFGIWMLVLGPLTALVWRATRTTVSALCSAGRVKRLALARGRALAGGNPGRALSLNPVYELDEPGVLACAVGIRRPLIMVSAELHESLCREEFEVVVAHEEAHIAARHNLVLLVARVIEKALFFFPGAREAHRGVRRSVEMAADASATDRTNDALLVASSLSRVAGLLFDSVNARSLNARPIHPRLAAAFLGSEELVVQRVRRLVADQRPAGSRRRLVLAVAALALAFSVFGSGMYALAGNSLRADSQISHCARTSAL